MNLFLGLFLPITDSSRAVFSYWPKICKVLKNNMQSFGTVPTQSLREYATEQSGMVNCRAIHHHLMYNVFRLQDHVSISNPRI